MCDLADTYFSGSIRSLLLTGSRAKHRHWDLGQNDVLNGEKTSI